ncbi:uncharacterized protein LOC124535496 [Vanessa cardui]|uniref:uncharacterized protein LOC124535496 n=1 Tax=Vanessa cardui TaxID=171605 RepID=UPI001F149500|nr:uncharacterized protein LOC124535496 [Vanessa cardui]
MNTMVNKGLIIFVAFAAITFASEIEDVEQKKRGAGKANALNAILTGAQKTDYNFNIYPSGQNPSQTYQSQVPNSFYPSQTASQYYSSSNSPESSISSAQHTQVSPQTTQSQFVPINFVPNPGYQSKYQLLPQKSNGNVQLAIIQQPSISSAPMIQYPHSFFAPNPATHIGQSTLFGPLSHGHFSFAPSYQPLQFSSHFLSQPSGMVVLPQPHPTLYNNLVYPNPTQSFYNYYPSSSQAKYSYASGASPSNEYEKLQSSVPQSSPKEDTGNYVQNPDYVPSSDSNSGYKSSYNTRTSYAKI